MKQPFNSLLVRKKYLWSLALSLVLSLLSTLLLITPANATGVYQLPSVAEIDRTWVIDNADVLSRITEGKISNELEQLAKETGNQVRFVTIYRLDYGETAQSFTDKLFEKWFPTPETQAHQTLLAIDTLTSTTGIRTGEAIEAIMPDDIADSIASETVLVPLREGNKFNEAFLSASDRLVAVLSGEPDPGPPVVQDNVQVESTFKSAEETDTKGSTIIVVVLLIAATVIPMATYFFYQNQG